ncbi:MAG: tRNA preQ1(34) S-adenosylmethionine ribosyltransferase-isomerase QueA [Ktedonobacteraceae bacterium]
MRMSDFDYALPPELIAQTPIEPRDASRLLVVQRTSGTVTHRHFHDIGEHLRPGDLLIANHSRVIPARLLGHRAETGGTVEVLLLSERPDLGTDYWEALVRPGRRLRVGDYIIFDNGTGKSAWLQAEVMAYTEAGGRIVRLSVVGQEHTTEKDPYGVHNMVNVRQMIDQLGRMPLPPYIHETLADPERYQTVYSRITGSAAAPTAGLHFTSHLLETLQQQGVQVGFVTLHVGLDTFRPVEVEDYTEHKIHSEEIELNAETAKLINETKARDGRVIAVGTTSVRVLESVASMHDGQIEPYKGSTRLFITPGYHFMAVDAMITNFHLPRSTLLLLVSAFMGKDLMENVYREAIRERYRFFSFGDAVLLL